MNFLVPFSLPPPAPPPCLPVNLEICLTPLSHPLDFPHRTVSLDSSSGKSRARGSPQRRAPNRPMPQRRRRKPSAGSTPWPMKRSRGLERCASAHGIYGLAQRRP